MPRIAFFFGISIYRYMDDHGAPDCHVAYGDYAGALDLVSGNCLAGLMPPLESRKIQEWIVASTAELLEKWHELSG